MTGENSIPELKAELADLRARLAEAEETLRAIHAGEVEALVIAGNQGDEVHLLGAGDRVYRQFIETASEGTATVSGAGEILSCNDCLAKTLRRPPDQVLGTAMRDHVSPDDHEAFRAILAQTGSESSRRKIRLITGAGALVPVYLSATLLHNAGADRVYCLVLTNLEEVISIEETLQESAEEFRATFEQAAVGIAHAILDGRWLRINQKFADIVGYTVEELLTKTFRDITHPDDLEKDLVGVRQILAGEINDFSMEKRYIRKDTSIVWINLTVSLVRNHSGEPKYLIAVIEDIMERKRTEADRERLTVAIEQAAETVMVTDAEGTIQYVNPVFETLTGYTRAEAVGKNPRLLKSGVQDEAFYRGLWDTLKSGRVWQGRLVNRRKDGSLYTEETTISPVHDDSGRTVSYVAVKRDITEHLHLAEERAGLEDQLRQAQKVESIGRLAGGVAHDFNNLTAIILGYGEMLLGRLRPEDPLRKYAEQIMEAGQRSAALTRQLLAFSRKQTLQPEVLDLNVLLKNFEKMLGRLIREDIQLELKLAATLGRVTADPGQIEQVVTNLVLNARDAMAKGGRLTIETADVELDQIYALGHMSVAPGRYVMLAVTDTGSGIDQANMAKLFEPFFTTKEKGKGTGLGLATAYGIVKQSGGYIWAYSEPGKGTSFKIYLPRTDAAATEKAVQPVGVAPRGGGELILLVEDEVSLRELCGAILVHLGYRVSAAGSGPEALLLMEEKRLEPDLVITDVIMPGMSGSEMAERLRKDRPHLKVLYMSGYPDDAIARHGVLDPGTPFIQKPFNERTLATKVRETLGGTPPGRRVLMIDDDAQFRELVQHFCVKRGHVFAGVDSAAAALLALAGESFDVLLVDLNIPGTSGEQVLREIRAAGNSAPAIVLTGDVASADMAALRPLGVVQALEKSSNAGPLLRAIEKPISNLHG